MVCEAATHAVQDDEANWKRAVILDELSLQTCEPQYCKQYGLRTELKAASATDRDQKLVMPTDRDQKIATPTTITLQTDPELLHKQSIVLVSGNFSGNMRWNAFQSAAVSRTCLVLGELSETCPGR